LKTNTGLLREQRNGLTTSLSRRSMLKTGAGAGVTAAMIGGMTFPKSMVAQTPAAEIPPKELSGTAVLVLTGEPQSFQPDFQADDYLWPIACNIYNSLFSLDNDFNVIPELATAYEVAEDGLSITVTLNPLATWHDGEPVTSADVKYTLEQIVNDPASTSSTSIGALSTVDTPDDHTAVLNLSQPSASIIGFLSWYGVFILPAHIYEGTDWTTNEANQAPIGSGPFKFVSYEPGSSVELEANTTYFGEGPYLERLIYSIIPDANTQVQALLNGEVDFVDGIPSAQVATLEATEGFKIAPKIYPSPIYFGFNMTKAPLDNVDVRRAIGMAIDREQILATALSGYGTTSDRFYPAVIEWASNPDAVAPAFDAEGANALLDGANLPLDGDSRFSIRLLYFTGWPEVADTATVLKEQFAAIGVSLELVALEYAAWQEQMEAGDFELGMLGGFQGPDPANLVLRVGTDGGINYWGYSNPELDELLKQGDAGLTQEERAPIYFEAQEILAQDLPVLQLVLQTYYSAFTDRLSGIWLDPDDPAAAQAGMNRFTLTKLEG
jgi:peptide/nickel transport system substrate-binding protein